MRVASNWLCMYIQIKNDIWCPPHWRSPSEGCCSRLLISIRMLESQWVRQIVGGYGFCKIAGSTKSWCPLSLIRCIDGWRDFGKERWCKFIRLLHIEILECWNIRCKYRHLHLATHRLVDVTTPLSTAAQLHPPNYDFNSHACTDNFNLRVPMSQTNSLCLRRETKQ